MLSLTSPRHISTLRNRAVPAVTAMSGMRKYRSLPEGAPNGSNRPTAPFKIVSVNGRDAPRSGRSENKLRTCLFDPEQLWVIAAFAAAEIQTRMIERAHQGGSGAAGDRSGLLKIGP